MARGAGLPVSPSGAAQRLREEPPLISTQRRLFRAAKPQLLLARAALAR
jgi:hypothetical protein